MLGQLVLPFSLWNWWQELAAPTFSTFPNDQVETSEIMELMGKVGWANFVLFPRLPNNQLENAGSSQKSWNLRLRNIYEICIKSWPGQRFPKFALLNWQKSGQKFTTCKGGGLRCCFEILEFVAIVGEPNFFHDFILDFVDKVGCTTFFEENS